MLPTSSRKLCPFIGNSRDGLDIRVRFHAHSKTTYNATLDDSGPSLKYRERPGWKPRFLTAATLASYNPLDGISPLPAPRCPVSLTTRYVLYVGSTVVDNVLNLNLRLPNESQLLRSKRLHARRALRYVVHC